MEQETETRQAPEAWEWEPHLWSLYCLVAGQIVVMDNLLGAQGRSGSTARGGCRARALVPAVLLARHEPIEEAFSTVKGTLRKAGSRTRDALVEGTGRALDAIIPEDIRGFYADRGYRVLLQSL